MVEQKMGNPAVVGLAGFGMATLVLQFHNVGWTIYTAIMWIAAMRVNGALAMTFTLLLLGFILLDIGHFGYPAMNKIAGYELMLCALNAWYVMAHLIFTDVFEMDVLPVGKPWLG